MVIQSIGKDRNGSLYVRAAATDFLTTSSLSCDSIEEKSR